MKNKIIVLILTFFSCGNVYALPQDWPCKEFVLENYEKVKDDDINIYRWQDDYYALKVNVFWHKNTKSDDCGTAGCDGIIKNLKTGQKENLRFFCEAEENYSVAKCNIRVGEEYILQKVKANYYQVNLCNEAFFKYVYIHECSECFCVLHDSRKEGGDSDLYMKCKIENSDKLHCITGNIYEEKMNPIDSDDFKNCVGSNIK